MAIVYRDGRGKLQWEGKFKTKGDAQRRLNAALGELESGVDTLPRSTTFEQFARDWLSSRKLLRGGTEEGYASVINNQLIPHLGNIQVTRLRFEHVEAVVSGMVEDHLAPKTIRNAIMLLRTMLWGRKGRAAFRRGLGIVNPTFGVRLPSVAQRQIVPPTPDQVWRLIDAAKAIGGAGYPITYLGAFCGMRRNEILALRLEDVRWFENEIRVRHAITRRHAQDGVRKWEWYLGPPKSRKSLRSISATEIVMRLLADLKVGRPDSAYVVAGKADAFVDPDHFEASVWRQIVERAGLKGTRFHDLRHFFASQLIANGETATYVRDQMGHASIHTTFDTYGHLFPGRGKEASARYEKSMETARRGAEGIVSNPLAIEAGERRNEKPHN